MANKFDNPNSRHTDLQRLSDAYHPPDTLDPTERVLRALAQDEITAGPRFKQHLIMALQAEVSAAPHNKRQPWHLMGLRWALGMILLVSLIWGITPRLPERAVLTVHQGSALVTWSRPVILWWQRHGQRQVVAAQASEGAVSLSIAQGDQVTLSDDGEAVLTLFEGSRVELRPGTQVTLAEARPGSARRPLTVRVRVTSGEVMAQRQHAVSPGENFELETPAAVIQVYGRMAIARVVGPNHTHVIAPGAGATDESPLQVRLDDPALGKPLAEVSSGYEVDAVMGQPLIVKPQPSSASPQPTARVTQPSKRGVVTYTIVYTDVQTVETGEVTQSPQGVLTVALPPTETFGGVVQVSPSLGLVGNSPPTWFTPTLVSGTRGSIVFTATTDIPAISTSTQTLTETEGVTTTQTVTETQPEDGGEEEEGDEVVVEATPDDEPARVDIAVGLGDTPDPVSAGESLVYTLVVTNYGPEVANPVIVTNVLSSKVRFITATPLPMVNIATIPNILVWDLGRLTAGAVRMLSVVAHISQGVTGTLRTTARVSVRSALDELESNNVERELTRVVPPPVIVPPVETHSTDLEVVALDAIDMAPAGGVVTYTLAYTNAGSASAEDVALVALLPPEMRFGGGVKASWPLTLTVPPGWVTSTWNLEAIWPPMTLVNLRVPVWTTPTLPAGETGRVVFTATLNPSDVGLLTTRFAITNTVPDERPTDNLGSTRLTVMPAADLAITAFTSPDPAVNVPPDGLYPPDGPYPPAAMLTYTLVYTNAGPWNARSVLITDALPTGVTYGGVVHTDPPLADPTVHDERRDGRVQVLSWFISELPAGTRGTLVFTTTLAKRLRTPLRSKVTIAGRVWDQPKGDNEITLTTDVRRASLLVKQSPFTVYRAPLTLVPRMPLTYTVWVTNTGGVTLTPRLVQILSPGFRYVPGSGWPQDPEAISMTAALSATVGVSPTAGLSPAFALAWDDVLSLSPGQWLSVSFAVEPIARGAASQPVTLANPTLVTDTVAGVQLAALDAVSVALTSPSVAVAQRVTGYRRGSAGRQTPIYMTFTVQITNTGPSMLDVVPLRYTYDAKSLQFVRASPSTDSVAPDGVLTWHDVTTPTHPESSAGMRDAETLASARGLSVTLTFSTVRPLLTGRNVAIITGARDIYQNAVAEVKDSLSFPLIAELDVLHARYRQGQIRLAWTATEIDDVGYRVLRASEPRFNRATDVAFIPSQCQQAMCQATYAYTDTLHTTGDALPWYWVIAVDVLGDERRYGPVQALSLAPPVTEPSPRLFLPLVLHQP